MDEYFALYAVPADNLQKVAATLTRKLAVAFSTHESGYWGEYFLHGDDYEEHVKIYFNSDPMWRQGDPEDERFFKPEFRQHPVLVEATHTSSQIAAVRHALFHEFPGTVELLNEPVQAQPTLQADGPASGGSAA